MDKKFQFATIKTKEDFVLWIKLLENNVKMLGLNETLTYWRKLKDLYHLQPYKNYLMATRFTDYMLDLA